MKKKAVCLLTIVILLVFSSCTQIPENTADEIRFHNWALSTKYDKKVILKFNGDKAIFKVKSKDKAANVTLRGLCIIDKNKIAIYNEYDKENYIFTYKLKLNKLTLVHSGGKITLTRINKGAV